MARQTNKENCKVRVIAIYRMLIRGKQITAGQIIEELHSHYGITAERKTIYSDIAAIDRIMPIKITTGRGGGYRRWDVIGEADDFYSHGERRTDG